MYQIIDCKYDYSDKGGYNCINLMCDPHIPPHVYQGEWIWRVRNKCWKTLQAKIKKCKINKLEQVVFII